MKKELLFAILRLSKKKAAKLIKENMDKKFGPTWQCIIGEGMCFDVNYQEKTLVYCYANANLAVLLFKS